ncbi:MAG: RND transporter [Planctomycetes bacterium]|nr:RND transporter [Planctomycetota bacterium]
MMLTIRFVPLVCGLALMLAVGCTSQSAAPSADQGSAKSTETASSSKKTAHTHDSWWCDEHGVPEDVCGLCNSKLAAELQKKGDWCKEHDRPDSQCFKCHPELEARFAAQYEAKYGKKPPKPQG